MVHEKTSKLSAKVQNGEPVKLSFHYNNKAVDKFINSLFLKVLSNHDLNYLHGVIDSILKEMIINAVKANSKRVYFNLNNLDITDTDQYNDGMLEFKSFFINESDSLSDILKDNGYKVELVLKKEDDSFQIYVKNNVALLPFEEERINTRLEKARQYSDFSDMYMDISDESEGEGLGISLTILFLKNSGIGENSFKITSNGKITQSSITIPLTTRPHEAIESIQKRIADDIDELPAFPENVIKLKEMCQDRHVSFEEIASAISTDPSLVASVMKLSNSAGFVTMGRTENIVDAIKIIGLKNLNAILVTAAAKKIMDEKFSSYKEIWKHCSKTAFYARELASKFGFGRESDKFFLASMLHDLGKIVLLSVNSELIEHIEQVMVKKQMRTSSVLEEVTVGISHSKIGKMIAEKWNFPEYMYEAIGQHHSPVNSSEDNKDIVYITYLADSMCHIEENKFHFYSLEDDVLERFNLKDVNSFRNHHQEILFKYQEQQDLAST